MVIPAFEENMSMSRTCPLCPCPCPRASQRKAPRPWEENFFRCATEQPSSLCDLRRAHGSSVCCYGNFKRQGKGGFQKSEVNMNIMKYHEISIEYPLNQQFINILSIFIHAGDPGKDRKGMRIWGLHPAMRTEILV